MFLTGIVLCLFADAFVLTTGACSNNCAGTLCPSGDTPHCHSSKCVCKRKDGVCFGSADCKYGYNCEHPICDTAHHHCLCGHLPHDHKTCTSSSNCDIHCGHEHHDKACIGGKCYCIDSFSPAECGHHHPHHDETCPSNSCNSPYSPVCVNSKCGCMRSPYECVDNSGCTHHHCLSTQEPICVHTRCTCIDRPVDGGWSAFGPYSHCTASCGGGKHTRTRTCTHPTPQHGGKNCVGSSTETHSCNTNPCPINGGWSNFGSYGHCSVSCGGGSHTRSRTCNHPTPQHGGKDCVGSPNETESCNDTPCPINGGWSHFGSYGHCSVSCGGGSQTRSRTCTHPTPQHGGKDCVGSSTVTHSCNHHPCPINGGWSHFGSYSQCSVSCGGGNHTRSRTCTHPTPQHGGKNCVGSSTETHSCNNDPCPTAAPSGAACPTCDESLNCVWGRVCPEAHTCMIRSYPHYKFSVHCSVSVDCQFMKSVLSGSEIFCCDDRQCLSDSLGI
ncbi:hemicentin-1-like isoform X2 [Crassostrea virginica]